MSYDKVLFKHDEPHGAGDVYFIWQKGGSGSLLATTGSDGSVAIFNRNGHLVERIILQGLCSGFSWDADGDLLGIITVSSSQVTLWDANTQKRQLIDTGVRDHLSCILWSKQGQIMAVGTTRGNLAIYNHHTSRRIPILGKHSKRIVCGAWSNENLLALGSDDKSFSLSNEEGDSLRIVQLRDVPSDMYFAEMKTEDKIMGENTISMIIGKRTLFLYYLPEPDSPTELGFQTRYGSLIQHKWFGEGFILLGFSNGHLVAISTNPKEVGQELWQVKNHRDILTGVAFCPILELVASCGDNNIKIHSISNLQETEKIITLPDRSGIQMVDWSSDGQLLAATTAAGSICAFVTKLDMLYSVFAPRIAILSSIAEVSIHYSIPEKTKVPPTVLNLEIEPSFIGVGPYHFAAGMNNHVWFYDLGRTLADRPMLLGDREFVSEIREIHLNADFCAALCGGHLILQSIESENPTTKNKPTKSFPEEVPGLSGTVITCLLLRNEFLIFATDIGDLIYFAIKEWNVCVKYRHTMGIKSIYGDRTGTKLVIIDDSSQGFLFLPTTEETILIAGFPKKCLGALWDSSFPNVFIAYDSKICITYNFIRYSVDGKHIVKVGETMLRTGQVPVLMYDGEMSLCVEGGKFATLTLATHILAPGSTLREQLSAQMKLRRYKESFKLCERINSIECWRQLGQQMIEDLEPGLARRVYQKIEDAAMYFLLDDVDGEEEINSLSGYCCLLLDRPEEAKKFFVKSNHLQIEALHICRDLLQWEQAMQLAQTIEPNQVPFIAREYAQQLEFGGNFSDALIHYEKGYKEDLIHGDEEKDSSPQLDEHIRLCKAGIARTSIKTGDYRRGIQLAVELNDKQLFYDCAESLVSYSSSHLNEAAGLLEKGEYWDEACSYYIQLKSWNRVKQLLPKISSTKILASYASAKESVGHYQEAVESYKKAGDFDAAVRIYLEHMSDPHSASETVLESRSSEGAKMLSQFYHKIGDSESAIHFLVICGCLKEAFEIAKKEKLFKRYGELIEQYEHTRSNDFLVLAQIFEEEKFTLLAGKYYFLGKEFSKALKFLLKASSFGDEENLSLSLAIDCVATSNNEKLTKILIDFLLGETDGSPKDPKYLFRLYMARKQFKDAAKTAIIIANQEQIAGNYRNAHDLLFSMYQELRRNHLNISAEMRLNLYLLHRYILVRVHVKLGNHLQAAKLLVQVAAHISQFPQHTVPILTSTVIECHRAGLLKSAFTYASMLMRQEYRTKIDPKYSKKIESVVRKAPKGVKEFKEDFDTETNECPICNANVPTMELTCYKCKSSLPICIATGQHIAKENITACPECDFPCFRAEMEKIISETNQCPMCNENVDLSRLRTIEDIRSYVHLNASQKQD